MLKYLFILILCLQGAVAYAQVPVWAFNIGSNITTVSASYGTDRGYTCKVAPNGNVYIAGKFSGTADLDPGAATYNITSNGGTDIFLACYSAAGNFIWGFNIGGANYDGAMSLDVDALSNVSVVGYFQGGADFDPGTGVSVLPYAGGLGIPHEGDGFVAKYSSSGVFQWAKDLGGTAAYDITECVVTDATGNVYVGGTFIGFMVVSPAITFSSGLAGTGYIIKYDPAGTVVWAHNFGEFGTAAVDCAPQSLKISGSHIYAGGIFRGTADFCPWGTSAILTAGGGTLGYDGFISKYDTNGNFLFVRQVYGSGVVDMVSSIALDASDNIYATGLGNSTSLVFNTSSPATSTVTAPGGGGNYDVFLSKYNSSGDYIWGSMLGSTGDDGGRKVEVMGDELLVTGEFRNTVDFDPSAAVSNLTSSGGADMFFSKYDLDGHYLCAFRTGDALYDDMGYGITYDAAGYVYTTGQFGGLAVDFDPTATVSALSSNGGNDAYFVKYNWAGGTFAGTITGDTICAGQTAMLTINITLGAAGPYNVTLSDGTTTFIVPGIMSGLPFAITPSPIATATYTVVSIAYAGPGSCVIPTGSVSGSAQVLVYVSNAVISGSVNVCDSVSLSAAPGGTYSWSFGDGASAAGNPVSHVYPASGTYQAVLTATGANGCTGHDTLSITTVAPVMSLGPDTTLCTGNSVALHASGTYTSPLYLWSNGSGSPGITVNATGTYWLRLTVGGCTVSDSVVVTVYPLPVVHLGPDVSFCENGSVSLSSSGTYTSASYFWSTGSNQPTITVSNAGDYTLTITEHGCVGVDTVQVGLKPLPGVALPVNTIICIGNSVSIGAAEPGGTTYLWSTGSTDSALSINSAGTYTLTVTKDGCSKTATTEVSQIAAAAINLGADTVLCNGDELQLHAADNVMWSNGTTGQVLSVTATGTYWAAIVNACGIITDTIKVDFDNCNIWFPNAFTPNNDGKNDIARVTGLLDYYKDFRLSIYNRFGERVFYTQDIYDGWDGNYKGVKQDLGTFYYMIFYTLHSKEHMLKGDLTLIR